jgi:transcriptional regulator GlxA family with amidase domain
MLERVCERFARSDAAAVLEANCLTGAVVARLLDRPGVDPLAGHRAKLAALLAHIDANLHTPLAADDLAAVAGLSPSRLRAVFQELMGTSPKQFVQERRVALARRLLADPSLAIKEVATKTGFADAFHFSKAFRKIDGLPPSVYRRQAATR